MSNLAERKKQIYEIFSKNMAVIKNVLPKHLTPERMLRMAYTVATKPELADCSIPSILNAVVMASELGLEISNTLGLAYLVPFKNKGKTEAQLIIGYRGLIELARRSGQIQSIMAEVVHENDEFEFEYGLNAKLRHVPARGNKGERIGVYAVAQFKDGGHAFVVLWAEDVMAIKATSKAAKSSHSPWNKGDLEESEMWKKTAIRRLCKYLPLSPELTRATALDEAADIGKQNEESFIDVDFEIPKDNGESGSNGEEKTSEKVKELLKSKKVS